MTKLIREKGKPSCEKKADLSNFDGWQDRAAKIRRERTARMDRLHADWQQRLKNK